MSARLVKCVVWDLDGTLWHGVLAEGAPGTLRDGVAATVRALDARGVLQSVASRNDQAALEALERCGLAGYLLHPQLSSGPKSASIARIAELFDLDPAAMAFLDDEPYERAEVLAVHPGVLALDAGEIEGLLDRPELRAPPGGAFLARRALHLTELERRAAEAAFAGSREAFARSLAMRLTIRPAIEGDLARVEELTERTHRLNTTGRRYSRAELRQAIAGGSRLLLVAEVTDRFGAYGTIGLAVIERAAAAWTLELLLMSCRVIDRGVGGALLGDVMRRAREDAAPLRAELVLGERNRRMYITLKLAGFQEVERRGEAVLLAWRLAELPPSPPHLTVEAR